jgi:hypothetical protein
MAAEGYTSDKAAYDQAIQSGIGNLATAAMYKGMYKAPKYKDSYFPMTDYSNLV